MAYFSLLHFVFALQPSVSPGEYLAACGASQHVVGAATCLDNVHAEQSF